MHIIGGEFAINNSDLSTTKASDMENLYSCGRAALYAILLDTKVSSSSKILLPDYICDSVIRTVLDAGYEFELYHIEESLTPDLSSFNSNSTEFNLFLLVNYFGITDLSDSINYIRSRNRNSIIIVDNVQNVFGFFNGCDGDYSFTSYRKWFALPDGAEVKCCDNHTIANFNDKNSFFEYKLAGNYLKNCERYIDPSVYLDLLDKGESILDDNYRCRCSDYTRERVHLIDRSSIIKKRRQNSLFLHKGLTELGIRHLYNEECVPMFIPIFIEDRDSLRKAFFDNGIFSPVHWDNKHIDIRHHNDLYETELSLICDQRYNTDDMNRILDIIKAWI